MKRKKGNYIYLPAWYLDEGTGHYQSYQELPEDRIVEGDKPMAALLGVSIATLNKWKKQGVVTPDNPRQRVFIYKLRKTLIQLRAAGYFFENELSQ